MTMLPVSPALVSTPFSSNTFTSNPGTGNVADPIFILFKFIPNMLEQIAQPVSVCHQWSITGQDNISDNHS